MQTLSALSKCDTNLRISHHPGLTIRPNAGRAIRKSSVLTRSELRRLIVEMVD